MASYAEGTDMTNASTGMKPVGPPNEAPDAPMTLECRDIEKAFGGVPVLKGVSLALQPGTITALAGENGAGKSTLMKIASGQYRPDSGQVSVRGEELPAGHAQAAHR